MAYGTIAKCDIDIRRDLYQNVILAGGSALFRGMSSRVREEINNLAPLSASVEVTPATGIETWAGGSIFSQFSPKKPRPTPIFLQGETDFFCWRARFRGNVN